jgi:multidrug efflux pump subunit AcrA (membrane-fusion protein)
MAKKRLFTISFLSIVGYLLVFGGYWLFAALFVVDKTIPPEKLAKVESGSIARSVVATGKVEPLSKVDIKSKASGLVKYLYVNAGDRVREGQLLVELEKDNVTRFEVRVSILNDLDLLKVNMSANAEIILEEHHNVLLIPESSLIYNEKRATFVEIPDSSTKTGRRQIAVKTGLGNGSRTELLSGLKLGEQVILQ